MVKICEYCEQKYTAVKHNRAQQKYCSVKCNQKSNYLIRKKKEKNNPYIVYYLPKENYCGVTRSINGRISSHKYKGKNIKDYKILFMSFDKDEAYYTEARFQGVLGMFGLNY